MSDVVLILLRHFPSIWNDPSARRFTGWADVELARGSYRKGIRVGQALSQQGFQFDECCTSTLKRAVQSLAAVLEGLSPKHIVIGKDERLNERNYGTLQGKLHSEVVMQYGEEQVREWRRSFDSRPPGGESLKDTRVRVVSYWRSYMVPLLEKKKKLLVVAHGNSLRALIMHIAEMSPERISNFEIPTGKPLLCLLHRETLLLQTMEYLQT